MMEEGRRAGDDGGGQDCRFAGVIGDGVAVPVVRWLASHLLEPLLTSGDPAVLAAE